MRAAAQEKLAAAAEDIGAAAAAEDEIGLGQVSSMCVFICVYSRRLCLF